MHKSAPWRALCRFVITRRSTMPAQQVLMMRGARSA
jgi:hypothetical protein